MNREQFDKNITDLKAAAAAENPDSDRARRAKADLGQIEQYKNSLLQLIENGVKEIESAEFSSIKDALQKYIADPKYAYAVETVEIHTPRLLHEEGVVFLRCTGPQFWFRSA